MNFFDDMERFGDDIAFITESGDLISYSTAVSIVDTIGTNLSANDLVFLLVQNQLESVAGYLACLRTRAKAALLAHDLHADFFSKLIALYRPQYLWMPTERLADCSIGEPIFRLGNYVLLRTEHPRFLLHSDLALLMTTSGSTGAPKFVRQSYRNIESNTDAIAECLGIDSTDKAISSLPLSYVYGLSVLNTHLAKGASILLTKAGITERHFWALFREYEVTSLAGVPYTYEILQRLKFQRMELPSLRTLTQAGGKLNESLVRDFTLWTREKGVRFFVMYGAAEATARMAYLPPEAAADHPSSIGIPIPGGHFAIIGESGQPIGRSGVVGELCYSGANVTMGYATSGEDLARGDERQGSLETGDLATVDEDGFYYIVGRRSRFVKLFGNRVNLEDLEQLIRTEGIDCACTGNDSAVSIYITNAQYKDHIVSLLHQMTKLHPSAFKTVVVEQIPRNAAGKISYSDLS